MLTQITFALLAHLGATLAQGTPGVLVKSNTGPLSPFSGGKVTWRSNGDAVTWGDGAGLEFVPTTKDSEAIDQVKESAKSWGSDVTHILTFDAKVIADKFGYVGDNFMRSYEVAILEHNKITAAIDPKYKVGAPLIFSQGAILQEADQWFGYFEMNCMVGECRFDFVPIEYAGNSITDLDTIAKAAAENFDHVFTAKVHKVWITKLTCQKPDGVKCTEPEAIKFLQDVQTWVESTTYIERWVWDGASPQLAIAGDGAGLLAEDGSLSPLGKLYVGV